MRELHARQLRVRKLLRNAFKMNLKPAQKAEYKTDIMETNPDNSLVAKKFTEVFHMD